MIFADISNFSNISDYLPILNGILILELVMISLNLTDLVNSKNLKTWYQKYQLSAVISDIVVIFLGIIVTRIIYPFFFTAFNLGYFLLTAFIIQIIHDLLFYSFFSSLPHGTNKMLDLFKDYANEIGINAIIGDTFLAIFSIILASIFANYSTNINIIILAIGLYLLPYILHM